MASYFVFLRFLVYLDLLLAVLLLGLVTLPQVTRTVFRTIFWVYLPLVVLLLGLVIDTTMGNDNG